MQRIEPLANDYITVYASDVEKQEFAYTPGICVLPGGRIIATLDHKYPDIPQAERGMAFLSDDGVHFRLSAYFPFVHARPFVAGDALYIIGVAGPIGIIRSDDGGETWSAPAYLTPPEGEGCSWHATAANVWYTEDRVYLAMEHRVAPDCVSWPVAAMAPVLLRANVHDDLLRRESWTFASEVFFRDAVDQEKLDDFGVPFFEVPRGGVIDTSPVKKRTCAPIGWLETNVARILLTFSISHNYPGVRPCISVIFRRRTAPLTLPGGCAILIYKVFASGGSVS